MLPDSIENVLPRALDRLAAGRRICLATLVYVAGSAPRPLGSQMLIAEDGEHYGYLSGGCAEHAIADVGRAALAAGAPTVARFGEDSPYLDVRLPCGSGLDIHYAVDPPAAELQALADRLSARRPGALDVDVASGAVRQAEPHAERASGSYRRLYRPPVALVVVGAGPVAVELARLGAVQGMLVTLRSPDGVTLQEAGVGDAAVLRDERELGALAVDADTAVVTAFHEHEREFAVWRRFAASDAFYLGALGSARSHDARCRELASAGVDATAIARIRGPAGLVTGGRTAAEIALSIVAELSIVYRQQAAPDLVWDGGPLTVPAARRA